MRKFNSWLYEVDELHLLFGGLAVAFMTASLMANLLGVEEMLAISISMVVFLGVLAHAIILSIVAGVEDLPWFLELEK